MKASNTCCPKNHLLRFEADWCRVLFLHFEIDAEALADHVPLPLDLHEGKAYVSLVNFAFERLRFAGSGAVGRYLCRPISDHPFLNVRTYVRGPAGEGIFFIAEWINNPLSLRIGPTSHGLPYRMGRFTSRAAGPGGTSHLSVADLAGEKGVLRVTYPSAEPSELDVATAGSREAFLLERYRAYTSRAGKIRTFEVTHEPWLFSALDWVRLDPELLLHAFPWFRHARYVGGHRSPGVLDVVMHPPLTLNPRHHDAKTADLPSIHSTLPGCAADRVR